MASRLVGPTKTGYAFSSIVACDNRDTARHIELLRFKAGLLNTSRLPVPFEVELPAQAVAKASPLPENRDCIPELEKSAPIAGTAQGRRQVTGPRRDMCLLRLRQLAPRQHVLTCGGLIHQSRYHGGRLHQVARVKSRVLRLVQFKSSSQDWPPAWTTLLW